MNGTLITLIGVIYFGRNDNPGGNTILQKGRYRLEIRPIFRLVPNRYPPIK